MNFKVDKDCIQEVPNFISQSDADILIRYAEKTVSECNDPDVQGRNGRMVFPFPGIEDKEVIDVINRLEALVWLNTVQYNHDKFNFRVTKYEFFRDLEIVRWNAGGLGAHRDGHESIMTYEKIMEEGMPTSSLIYLTDDFEGGKLYFEDFDLLLKPKALSLVTFPSFISHSVDEVEMNQTQTPRYTIPFFYGYHVEPFGRKPKPNPQDYEYKDQSLEKVICT